MRILLKKALLPLILLLSLPSNAEEVLYTCDDAWPSVEDGESVVFAIQGSLNSKKSKYMSFNGILEFYPHGNMGIVTGELIAWDKREAEIIHSLVTSYPVSDCWSIGTQSLSYPGVISPHAFVLGIGLDGGHYTINGSLHLRKNTWWQNLLGRDTLYMSIKGRSLKKWE